MRFSLFQTQTIVLRRVLHIIIISLSTTITLYSQKDIKSFTITIIDTLDSEYNQSKDIYDWITSNIKYDIKKFEKFDNSLTSASEMLKKKKGVCSDYANLFKEMCMSVGIEAYIINGYSKGIDYYPGMPFLRSNHSWNAIFADSNLIICDATWGSGSLIQKPGVFNRILYLTTGTAFVNNKTDFDPTTVKDYFDISKENITNSHYPLDPKWLLSKYPISFGYFNADSNDKNFDFPYFEERIEEIRGKSAEYQLKVEGISSQKYNPLNKYNIANGYLAIASSYDIEKDINENNFWQFEKYFEEYNLIYESISKHKAITDSVYRSRFRSLKTLASNQKRLTNKIKSKTKSAKNSFQSKQKQITGKNSSYYKKLNGYILNIGRIELKFLESDQPYSKTTVDSIELNELLNEISILIEQEPEYNRIIDSLSTDVKLRIFKDEYLDDSIIAKNTLFNKRIISLKHMILSNDEVVIRQYVDSLGFVYSDISSFLNDKKNSKKEVEGIGRLYYSNSAELQKNLKQQILLLSKAYRVSNYSDDILERNNMTVKRLIDSYNNSMEFTQLLSRHNNAQKDIRKENLDALKEQRKSINKENKFFLAWYNHIYKYEKAKYENEKLVLKSILSTSQKNRKIVEMKIKKYNTPQK